MARLAHIDFTPHRVFARDGAVIYQPSTGERPVKGLPQLLWADETPWREANIYALERCSEPEVSLKTVQSAFASLLRYANWLEMEKTNWWHFPNTRRHRCLDRFRAFLISERDSKTMAPSTASQTMTQVVRFYRWLHGNGFFNQKTTMWTEKLHLLRYADRVGAERSMTVLSTDLTIKNRRASGPRLEDGLYPVSSEDRDSILKLANTHCSEELCLMLTLGFFTGMRLGTLTDLRVATIEHAVPDPRAPSIFYKLAVGPNAHPPVKTKFSVSGHILILRSQLDALKKYAYSVRRLQREAKAQPADKDLIFLTKFGNRYAAHVSDRSNAINVEMHSLRKLGMQFDLPALNDFHFHQTRATFASAVANIARKEIGDVAAIGVVKELLLHKSESISMRYIKFVKNTDMMLELGNEFARNFLNTLKD